MWFLDIPTLIAFLTAGILLNLTPGSDVIFTLATTLRQGTAAGLLAGLGITLGSLTHATLAALGLAALLKTNPTLFEAIRWAGVAYLLYLAVQAWRATPQAIASQSAERPFLRRRPDRAANPDAWPYLLSKRASHHLRLCPARRPHTPCP